MDRVLITIGNFNIYWYSFLIFISVAIGYGIATRYSRKVNINYVSFSDLLFYTLIVSIIGARLYYVIFNFSYYKNNLLDIFKIWQGGLAIYGAILSGILFMFYYCKKRGLPFVRILDILSLSLLLGQAIGRWGNFFNKEAYGVVCDKAFLQGLHLPNFIIDGMYINGFYHHPTFLYESLWCFIGVIILFFIRKRSEFTIGKQTCFYMIWYGIGRFFIEGLRVDSLYFGSLRISQVFSLLFVFTGIIGFIIIKFKKNKVITSNFVNNGRI